MFNIYLLCSYTEQLYTIPIIITMMTKDGASEQLRIEVQQEMNKLSEQLEVNISIVEVDRFGKTMLIILLL